MHLKHFVLLVFLVTLGACAKSNPYPSGTKTTTTPQDDPTQRTQKTYNLNAPFSVTCTEGLPCDFRVSFEVTNDSPVVSFDNLPAGATFDGNTGTVSWLPSRPEYDGQTVVVLVNLRGAHDLEVQRQVAVALVSRLR